MCSVRFFCAFQFLKLSLVPRGVPESLPALAHRDPQLDLVQVLVFLHVRIQLGGAGGESEQGLLRGTKAVHTQKCGKFPEKIAPMQASAVVFWGRGGVQDRGLVKDPAETEFGLGCRLWGYLQEEGIRVAGAG